MSGSTGLPTGTVTFMFTDVEDSTLLPRRLGDAFIEVNDRHLAILRTAISAARGITVRTEGDTFFAVFRSALSAIEAAAAAPRALADQPWPKGVRVAVRMGLHTGEGTLGTTVSICSAKRIGAGMRGLVPRAISLMYGGIRRDNHEPVIRLMEGSHDPPRLTNSEPCWSGANTAPFRKDPAQQR